MTVNDTLYARLGGYDAIASVVDNLLSRLTADALLGRFWANRGEDGIAREKQLLIGFLCANAGGAMLYTGRENRASHRGMGIGEKDWACFVGHLEETLAHFKVPEKEKSEVLKFIGTTKDDIVERA